MKNTFLGLIIILSLLFVSGEQASAAPDQGRDIEALEHVLFSINKMPTNRSDGEILIYKNPPEDEVRCTDCEVRLSFSANVKIKVAGNKSTMTLEQLSVLPEQRVTVEARDGRMLSIGFTEVERGTNYRKDI